VVLLIAEYQLTVRCVGQTLRYKFEAATDAAAVGGRSTVDREKLTDPGGRFVVVKCQLEYGAL
jgi:hypothetical protein